MQSNATLGKSNGTCHSRPSALSLEGGIEIRKSKGSVSCCCMFPCIPCAEVAENNYALRSQWVVPRTKDGGKKLTASHMICTLWLNIRMGCISQDSPCTAGSLRGPKSIAHPRGVTRIAPCADKRFHTAQIAEECNFLSIVPGTVLKPMVQGKPLQEITSVWICFLDEFAAFAASAASCDPSFWTARCWTNLRPPLPDEGVIPCRERTERLPAGPRSKVKSQRNGH